MGDENAQILFKNKKKNGRNLIILSQQVLPFVTHFSEKRAARPFHIDSVHTIDSDGYDWPETEREYAISSSLRTRAVLPPWTPAVASAEPELRDKKEE